jgi:type I restriction enzyme S subunit
MSNRLTRLTDLVAEVNERNPPIGAEVFSVSERYGIIPQRELFHKQIALDDLSKYRRIQNGDVVFNPYLLWNGAAGVCFHAGGGCVSPAYPVLRPRHAGTERFLHYLFRSSELTAAVDAIASGSVTRRRTAALEEILDLAFQLPDIRGQRELNHFLKLVDDRLALDQQMNVVLEGMAHALFQSWFVDFDPMRSKTSEGPTIGRNSTTDALFPAGFKDSAIGQIPQGWSVESLAELMDIEGGTQPPASEFLSSPKVGYLRLVQIRDYESDDHLTFVRDSPRLRKCCREDIMIARYGASVARICWGLEGAYNVALVRVVPKKTCAREYLRSYLQSAAFQTRLIGMSHRSVQAGFNKKDIASFQIAIPPEPVLLAYESTAWRLRARILQHMDHTRTLATMRDTLLPKLLSGDLKPTTDHVYN